MAKLNMYGPYDLTDNEINRVVTETSPGNYALGSVDDDNNAFLVSRTGRSDDDVNGRLHDHTGEYDKFKFSYASSAKAAFEKECENYHDFPGIPGNKIHPDRPSGTNWKCPRCSREQDKANDG